MDEFYNDSTGEGENREIDARGPWNEGGDGKFIEAPAFAGGIPEPARKSVGSAKSAKSGAAKKRTSK